MPIHGPWFVFPVIGLVLMIVVSLFVFGPSGPPSSSSRCAATSSDAATEDRHDG